MIAVVATHPRLALDGVSKSFGGIQALVDVSLDVAVGEVHAILGENGAGKSTAVKIITGFQPADSGEIRLDGAPVSFSSPLAARAAGIVAVYQDPKLFPHLDVAENIFMGQHPTTRMGTVARRRMYQQAEELLTQLDAEIDPHAVVAGLSIGQAQFVEFARAFAAGADRLLILDEPTAALTPAETQRLFKIVRRLRQRGTSVIFISHRLEELEGLVDTVTVLRDGRRVATLPASELTEDDVVRLMVGRTLAKVDFAARGRLRSTGPPALRVEGLAKKGVFEGVSFEVAAGEILGIAGLVGAGRSEIAQTIFGATPPSSGSVFVAGRQVRPSNPRRMLAKGVAYLPEDRDGEGLVTQLAVRINLNLAISDQLASFGLIRTDRENAIARRFIHDLQIKVASLAQSVASLSGGNRQKVVIGKWLALDPKVLILDEPTHGIDVGTKVQVHQVIRELAAKGVAVVMISSDLPEVLAVSDRILVVSDGRVTDVVARVEATQERIMHAASLRRAVQ